MIKKLISIIKIKKGVPFLFILIFIGALIELLSFSSLIPIVYFFSNNPDNQILLHAENLYEMFDFQIDLQLIFIFSILIIFSIKFLYVLFLNYFQSNFTANLGIKLNNFFLINYLKINNKSIKNKNTATLIRNVQNEVEIFVKKVFYPVLTLILELLFLALAIIALLIYNFKATSTLLLIFLTLSTIYYFFFKKRFYNWGKLRQFHVGRQLSVILESLNLRKIINIYDIEEFFLKKLNYHLYGQKKITVKNSILLVFPRVFLEFFFIFVISLAAIFYILKGNQLVDLFNILVVYTVIASRLFPAVSRIASGFQMITTGKASVNVLFNEKKIFQNMPDNKNKKQISFERNIKFKNLDLSIFDEKTKINKIILKDVSFEINKNQFIGLVGKTGVGKTTLINYLSGFLDADQSNIFIDGKEILSSRTLNFSNFGIVTQEPLIFDGTIKENLYFQENPKIDEKKLKKAIQTSDLETFIDQSKLGLETLINEKGTNISGGQLQRICIARALLFEPKLLILDEATSALDLQTEKNILSSLKKINDLTCIIISHRQETLAFCDKIYEIQDKKILLKDT